MLSLAALLAGVFKGLDSPSRRDSKRRASSPDWVQLDGCRLLPNRWNDGDSFHIASGGQDYLFRLYFVDTPEAESSLSARLGEQAAYFKISSSQAQSLGKRASEFTRNRLGGRTFTVFTRWRDALGRSKQQRFYSIVRVDGKDLGELLVGEGLARIYGTRVALPDGRDSRAYLRTLETLERTARQQRKGAWGLTGKAWSARANGTGAMLAFAFTPFLRTAHSGPGETVRVPSRPSVPDA